VQQYVKCNIVLTLGSPSGSSLLPTSYEDDDDETSQKKLKRGVLPKRATQIMKSWLFQHIAVSDFDVCFIWLL
jgi:hypothetical protein